MAKKTASTSAPAAAPEIRQLPIEKVRIDGGTQPRQVMDWHTVEEYAEALTEGARFPEPIVFRDPDGAHWLADGFHRIAANKKVGYKVMDFEVREGTVRDAVLFSVGMNATHGLRRTNDDKRLSVTKLLADAEWQQMSDGMIAELCQVTQPFVSKMRRERGESSGARKGRDGKVYETPPVKPTPGTAKPAAVVTTFGTATTDDELIGRHGTYPNGENENDERFAGTVVRVDDGIVQFKLDGKRNSWYIPRTDFLQRFESYAEAHERRGAMKVVLKEPDDGGTIDVTEDDLPPDDDVYDGEIYDAAKRRVPDHLREVFIARADVDLTNGPIAELTLALDNISRSVVTQEAARLRTRCVDAINLTRTLAQFIALEVRPYAVCPACKALDGECKTCRSRGWVVEAEWNKLPDALKHSDDTDPDHDPFAGDEAEVQVELEAAEVEPTSTFGTVISAKGRGPRAGRKPVEAK